MVYSSDFHTLIGRENRFGDSLAVYGLRILAFTGWDGVPPSIVSNFCRFGLPH